MNDEDYWYGAPKAGEEIDLIIEGAEAFKAKVQGFGAVIERAMREVMINSAITVLNRQLEEYIEVRRIHAPVKSYVYGTQWEKIRELEMLIGAYDCVLEDLKTKVRSDG
jgi:predicted thioredoxin/glutaredoxin